MSALYQSFRPRLVNHEIEQQPWLQAAVKARPYPLSEIAKIAQRAHFLIRTREAGILVPAAPARVTMIINGPTDVQMVACGMQLKVASTLLLVMLLAANLSATIAVSLVGGGYRKSASRRHR
jgi:hypothetical protein